MSSNIPKARLTLQLALLTKDFREIRKHIKNAIHMMTRDTPVRRAKGRPVKITPALRRQVIALSKTGMSQHQITSKVGLSNTGRVSETLRTKR